MLVGAFQKSAAKGASLCYAAPEVFKRPGLGFGAPATLTLEEEQSVDVYAFGMDG